MFIELATRRRSIRQFQNRPIEKEKVDLLLEAALRSPSSRGLNPWRFIVVDDPRIIANLSAAKPHGAAFLKNAPLAVVICAEPEISDVWVEDAAIASIFVHLAATDLGLGSCWIQIRGRDHDAKQSAGAFIAGLLGIPEGVEVESIMAIGYAAEEKAAHPTDRLLYDRVSYNAYGRTR